MDGFLDDDNTAYLTLDVGQGPLDYEVDTGLGGTLVIGEELFDESRAEEAGSVMADLAAERAFQYRTFFIEFRWLGEDARVRVLIGPEKQCLLGTVMLDPNRLEIDYARRTVKLIPQTA